MAPVGGQAPAQLSVGDALDSYARGDFQRVIDGRPFAGMDVVAVTEALERWIGPIDRRRATPAELAAHALREKTAARMAVDLTASRELTLSEFAIPQDDGQTPIPGVIRFVAPIAEVPGSHYERFNAPIVAWACARLPKSGSVEPWEPYWWLATIALLQDAGEWNVLRGNSRIQYTGSVPPAWRQVVRTEAEAGHLVEATRRLGSLPQLRLADAVTLAATLTDATRRPTVGGASVSPWVWGRYDVLRELEQASSSMNRGRFEDVERALVALLPESSLEAEVALRIGQLRMLRRDWNEALRWIDRATRTTQDPVVLATSDYFRGWILERTSRPAEALAAYRAAHRRFDRSPNLNTLLARQLMLAGERTEAARVLESSMQEKFDHGWSDLWLLLVEGDARHAHRYARLMREAR